LQELDVIEKVNSGMAVKLLFKSANHQSDKIWLGWILIMLAGLCLISGCRGSAVNPNGKDTNSAPLSREAISTPPYSTKEPKTYQARYVSSTELGGESNPLSKVIQSMKKERFVVKDGGQRRLDFELKPGIRISYLQLPEGKFALLVSKKLYAAIEANTTTDTSDSAAGYSPQGTADVAPAGSTYEKLGVESLNGRETTKYRVTPVQAGQQSSATSTETLIWVDENVGMPVKWQIISKDNSGTQSTFTEEMQDFKTAVDVDMLKIPGDFQLVSYANLKSQIN
jgi:outer membrane lipoprotein-sorting protein